MKKLLVGLVAVSLIGTGSVGICKNQPKHSGGYPKDHFMSSPHQLQDDARYIIHRTAMIIGAAQKAAERGHHYFSLREAIAHQQRARDLYWQRSYRDAIFHSLRARNIALSIIERNHEKPHREFYRDEMEERYSQSSPRDNDLDMKIKIEKDGNEKPEVHWELNLDINQ